ncbi:metal-dependent hydrolase family protein [Pseudoteredinibacter isoporae]|uniref:Imidazolonepropionase-like amidohydrolase n=1 Tax=Pseudoteredinibacter isoporae TaxID=570281 RepID=A0A7X0JPG0_9GAMM|nr:amidohydrolase family protein [Pseudoteredinibacter isoporae]MBB6519875.1 imidazolonepropionase-like amidohydrolase [Pseudoteredinibacter isoporae]NHO85453.1 amidohydrolase family protein [Pseudoteredinibacter isoporae]NIB26095.1 amidohydrolase family protein [Pseudoteredinibacter isoporae]
MKKYKLLTLALASLSMPVLADTQVIHAGTLLTVPGEKPLKEQSVIIKDGRIEAVKAGFISASEAGQDATLIDLKDSFVMPGLMDMHVHLQGELGPHNDSERLRMSDADVAMQSAHFAKKTLLAGFTTVRDLGAQSPQHIYALRDAIAKGWLDGPRIVASGGVAVTGGHGDVDGMRHDLLEKYTSKTICDGPFDCRRATRRAIKFNADVIKITSTGGVLSDTNTGTGQQMADDELKEVVESAHALGRKVASHAHAAEGINAALRAGVDSIEHGSYADKESIKLFRKTGAYLVPTLLAGDTVKQMAEKSNFMSDAIKAKAVRVGGDMMTNFARSYNAGVKIAFGTDSGVSRHGINAQEAVLMAQAGMTPMDVLESATINAADLIDRSSDLGTLEAGKIADIIATGGSPLSDIKELLDVDFVMKDGKVYKH